MAFQDDVVKDAWDLVEGRCECSKTAHQHADGRCYKHLIWEKRGQIGWGAWQACHIDGIEAHSNLSNCEIHCWECTTK
jgi:hypothetical protein